jgi:ABC-type antimicrobial peptide transport system permease subunit
MIRSLFLICLLSFNLSAENSEKALQDSLLKFWEARNARDFETIFSTRAKSGQLQAHHLKTTFMKILHLTLNQL